MYGIPVTLDKKGESFLESVSIFLLLGLPAL